MNKEELLKYIEDKTIKIDDNCFFHATKENINTVERIMTEGIKCAFLRREETSQGYNGKYYVSVSKRTNNPKSVYKMFEHFPIFVISGIKPLKADNKKRFFEPFMETIIPLRTSSYSDEYHVFMGIDPSKITALAYNLYHILSSENIFDIDRLYFLKQLVLMLEKLEKDIPIYDLKSNREINKKKVKMLNIDNIS